MRSLLRILLLICVAAAQWGTLPARASIPAAAAVANYQGLWWNPQESGWGINFAHQGDIVFATWFTYDGQGKPWWLIALKYLWDRPYSGYPGQKFEGSGKVRIRADIGGYRLAPAGAIQYKARGGRQPRIPFST